MRHSAQHTNAPILQVTCMHSRQGTATVLPHKAYNIFNCELVSGAIYCATCNFHSVSFSFFPNEYLVGFATEMLELKSYSGALAFNSCIHLVTIIVIVPFVTVKILFFTSNSTGFVPTFFLWLCIENAIIRTRHSVISFSEKIYLKFYAITSHTAWVHGNPCMSYWDRKFSVEDKSRVVHMEMIVMQSTWVYQTILSTANRFFWFENELKICGKLKGILITIFVSVWLHLFDGNPFNFSLLRNIHLQMYPNHGVYATDKTTTLHDVEWI